MAKLIKLRCIIILIILFHVKFTISIDPHGAPASAPAPVPSLNSQLPPGIPPVPSPNNDFPATPLPLHPAPGDGQSRRKRKGVSGGQTAGIVIGVLAGVALIGFGALVFKKRQANIRRSRFGFAARKASILWPFELLFLNWNITLLFLLPLFSAPSFSYFPFLQKFITVRVFNIN